MLATNSSKVCYAVLSNGVFMGMGKKLFALPLQALKLDTENDRYVLNVDSSELYSAPGFGKDNWPNKADETWANSVHNYYGTNSKTSDSAHSNM